MTRKTSLLVLDWCKKYLGKSNYFSIKTLNLRINNRIDLLGEFIWEKNTIYVNLKSHKNLLNLIETIIHEYVHFQQSKEKFIKICGDLDINEMSNHPYEIIAENMAKTLSKICYKQLKPIINN